MTPAGADQVRVTVRNGAAENRISVSAGAHQEALELSAWETREIRVPVPAGADAVALRIAPETGFVPAEVEPGSTDRRVLGCTVTVTLE